MIKEPFYIYCPNCETTLLLTNGKQKKIRDNNKLFVIGKRHCLKCNKSFNYAISISAIEIIKS